MALPIDDFDDNSVDTSKWFLDAPSGVSLTEAGGTANLDIGSTTLYGTWWTKTFQNMTGQRCFVKFVQPPQGMSGADYGCEVALRVTDFADPVSHTLDLSWHTDGTATGAISVNYDPGGGPWTTAGATVYNPNTHAWWSVRESGGNWIIETAPRSASNPPVAGDWTTFATLTAAAMPMSPASVQIGLTINRGDPGMPVPTGPAKFDGFNTAANSATVHATSGAATGAVALVGQAYKGAVPHAAVGALVGPVGNSVVVGVGATTAEDHRPSPVPSDWTEKYWRDYSRLNAISLNAGGTEPQTIADKGEYKAGAAFYRDWRSFGIAGYGHDVFTDPLVTGQLPAEYLIARPLGEIEPIPGVGVRLYARPSTGPGMNAAIATWFPAAIDLANSMATTVWTTGQLTTFTKISARPPFARVTYYIPRTDYAQKTFLAAMWSTEDGNREWPHDTDHSPFEYDDHEFLGNGTAGKASSTSIHAYGSPGYSVPIKNATIGNYNPPGGTFIDKLCGVLTVFGTADIKTYMNVNGGAWTLVATTTLASIAGAEYDQYHTAFIHDVSAGYPWEGTAGAATTPLSFDIVRVGIFAPATNPNLIVPAGMPPTEVLVSWRGTYGTSIPANVAVGTTIADLVFPEGVVSANAVTYGGRLAVVGTELRVASTGLNKSDQPVLRFHVQGFKSDGSKSIGRQWSTAVGTAPIITTHTTSGVLSGQLAKIAASVSRAGAPFGLASISDSFDGVNLDAAKWNQYVLGGASGSNSLASGDLRQDLTSSAVGNILLVESVAFRSLAGSRIYARLKQSTIATNNGAQGLEVVFGAVNADTSALGWHQQSNGTLEAQWRVGGVSNGVQIPYIPNTHAWLQVREFAGTIYWETAPATAADPPNDNDWTVRHSKPLSEIGIPINSMQIRFMQQIWSAAAGAPTRPVLWACVNTRTTAVITHPTSGVLGAVGAAVAGGAAKKVSHASSGALAGGGQALAADASRGRVRWTSGQLVSDGFAIINAIGSTSAETRHVWVEVQDTGGAWTEVPPP